MKGRLARRESLPDPETAPGAWLITPLQSFYEKGHFWMINKRWERVYVLDSLTHRRVYWVEKEIEIVNLGIKGLSQDASCCCTECKIGRKEVRSGYRPKPRYDVGLPVVYR